MAVAPLALTILEAAPRKHTRLAGGALDRRCRFPRCCRAAFGGFADEDTGHRRDGLTPDTCRAVRSL